ncbi:MAG: YbjN domain-containing protein [Desulfococcaceae bacterium]
MFSLLRKNKSEKILKSVEECLQQYGFEYKNPEDGFIILLVKPSSNVHRVLMIADEEERTLCVCVGGKEIPDNKRIICLEFIARVNHVNKMGCFDFDVDDGKLLYRHCIDLTGGQLTVEMVRQMLLYSVGIYDVHLNVLENIIESDITALDAHKLIAPEYYR